VTSEQIASIGRRQIRSLIILALLTVAMAQSVPGPGLRGRGLVILAGMVVAGAAWVAMVLRVVIGGPFGVWVGVCAAAGLVLCAAAPAGLAPGYVLAAVSAVAVNRPTGVAVAFAAVQSGALAAVLAAGHRPIDAVLGWTAGLIVTLLLGVVRRQRAEQAEQSRLLADETEMAHREQARAATLAERARLAREIHDVLAHSLAALSVQLETAAALLERDRSAEAAVIVDRAGRLARDGLTETRRAVSALRGDPVPLPDLVTALADGYRTDLAADASVRIDGEPRPLRPEIALALFRSAQEAITNVRKHGPGSRVSLVLSYGPAEVRLTVANHGPSRAPAAAALPSGYGLTGLRERAELAGGTMLAGPDGDGWLVDVRMPG
jgi:signal transduction histidine kinase